MPRNPSTGVYSKPAGTTPSVGQTIDPVPWNALTTDLGNEITNSLPRDGSAPMVAPLKAANGTVSGPAVAFGSNPLTGMYLKAGGVLGFAQNGVDIAFDPAMVYTQKTDDYTALVSDKGAFFRFTASKTLTLDDSTDLGKDWYLTAVADGAAINVACSGSDTINGATSLRISDGSSALIICIGSAFYAFVTPGQNAAKWQSRFVGEVVYANTALTGADVPPSSTTGTVWIELTSGLTGTGAFNEGKLTTENVSGSAPLVLATAVINFAASPMNGQTVRLLNTESRWLRPSLSPNTLQNDSIQGFSGVINLRVMSGGQSIITGFSGPFTLNAASGSAQSRLDVGGGGVLSSDILSMDPATAGVRTSGETRVKNVGVKAYMRIA